MLLLISTFTVGIFLSEPVGKAMAILPAYYFINLITPAWGENAAGHGPVGAVLVGCIRRRRET